MLKFDKKYFLLTSALLLTEIIIALYVHDNFVRPHIGDFLVVLLIFCFVKSFLCVHSTSLAIAVLVFAYSVEFLQYVNILGVLGLEKYSLARIIIGNSFGWIDLLAYTMGIGFLLLLTTILAPNKEVN